MATGMIPSKQWLNHLGFLQMQNNLAFSPTNIDNAINYSLDENSIATFYRMRYSQYAYASKRQMTVSVYNYFFSDFPKVFLISPQTTILDLKLMICLESPPLQFDDIRSLKSTQNKDIPDSTIIASRFKHPCSLNMEIFFNKGLRITAHNKGIVMIMLDYIDAFNGLLQFISATTKLPDTRVANIKQSVHDLSQSDQGGKIIIGVNPVSSTIEGIDIPDQGLFLQVLLYFIDLDGKYFGKTEGDRDISFFRIKDHGRRLGVNSNLKLVIIKIKGLRQKIRFPQHSSKGGNRLYNRISKTIQDFQNAEAQKEHLIMMNESSNSPIDIAAQQMRTKHDLNEDDDTSLSNGRWSRIISNQSSEEWIVIHVDRAFTAEGLQLQSQFSIDEQGSDDENDKEDQGEQIKQLQFSCEELNDAVHLSKSQQQQLAIKFGVIQQPMTKIQSRQLEDTPLIGIQQNLQPFTNTNSIKLTPVIQNENSTHFRLFG